MGDARVDPRSGVSAAHAELFVAESFQRPFNRPAEPPFRSQLPHHCQSFVGERSDSSVKLAELKIANVSLRHADGWYGWRSQAPFQGIIVAAAPEEVPPELCEQLDEGGCMVIPIGGKGRQQLLRVTREGSEFRREELMPVSFVPFVEGTET